MGIHDRDYYRRETSGSLWLTGQAPVTTALVLTSVAVFIAQTLFSNGSGGLGVTGALALNPEQVFERGEVWRLISAAFCHGSPWHLLWNMLWLWRFGRELEMLYGSREFLFFYLIAAVASSTAWALASWGGHASMVGASGAVAAVVVVYAMYYPTQPIHIFGMFPVEMRWIVLIWLGGDALLLLQHGYTGVAHMAHLGGALYGLLFKVGDLRLGRLFEGRPARPRLRVAEPEPEPRTHRAGLDARLEHRLDEILAKISREGAENLDPEERRILDQASQQLRERPR